MITVVSGQARSGTSLTMQMLLAAGYPVYWDRTDNFTTINPRGHYELNQTWFANPNDLAEQLNRLEGKFVKIFPGRWASLTPNHDYRMIYLDRDEEGIAQSQMVMFREEAGRHEVNYPTVADLLKDVKHWRGETLKELAQFPNRIVLQFSDLFTGVAQEQLGLFLGSTREQIEKMKACVEPGLRHF